MLVNGRVRRLWTYVGYPMTQFTICAN